MTITTTVNCDALSCCNEAEIEDAGDSRIEGAGFHVDPHHECFHYCSRCWPKVKKELEEEDA